MEFVQAILIWSLCACTGRSFLQSHNLYRKASTVLHLFLSHLLELFSGRKRIGSRILELSLHLFLVYSLPDFTLSKCNLVLQWLPWLLYFQK